MKKYESKVFLVWSAEKTRYHNQAYHVDRTRIIIETSWSMKFGLGKKKYYILFPSIFLKKFKFLFYFFLFQINIFLDYFNTLYQKWFFKIKKYYFDIFLNKN